ncbi:bifunctional adenosylcobinamide kinase/adenosylcobinamide-phosphate guanylyltransferase [Microtetraspora sp. NBRC 16547]|uniref:bifunctional adenosylcobinamide kinase/adenosylcobinamide-phosphate guanylyltransferase n=1 Tax=Microtetraspora sp. NBRC 16547 TaxID=3030993 RepID=UPI0024A0E0BD|nr:bifunctional adenosylcobinamide kinase/adenosylcobinamide-phosphate guanylyltransferase [Microtetraspora sp. NBRC 16547]GLW97122.1 adenosylcobinamide kinase/adenosylcobinamide phosphate guanyltransferase [Microtetraspora sp. NBRC 16547]
MKIFLEGTAGPDGWPSPGCGCASCGRLAPGHRRPLSIVLDDRIRLSPHPSTAPAPVGDVSAPTGGAAESPSCHRDPDAYRLERTPDGLAVTGPDGARLLHAALHSAERHVTDQPPMPFDVVLIDLLDRPERLGDLRGRGLVTPETRVIAIGLDHRVPSERELTRRLALWGADAVPDGTVLDTRDRPAPTRPAPRRTLLLGGTRSGKSEEAELRLAAEADVTYVATGPSGGDDPSWLARVKAHRDRRPAHWGTVETTDLAGLLRASSGTLLIDGLGTWIAAVFDECGAWPGYDHETPHGEADTHGQSAPNRRRSTPEESSADLPEEEPSPLDMVAARCDELVDAWRRTSARVVAVSDEVGLGVIPATASGRLFRDTLGRLNQRLARESEEVALVVAGRLLPLPI